MANRTITLLDLWARLAQTTIPAPPVNGTPYRNPNISAAIINQGWLYNTVVPSEYTNEYLYRLSYLVNQMEQQGILSWCSTTVYPGAGCLVLASNSSIYISKQGGTNKDPTTQAAYWELFVVPDSQKQGLARAWVNFVGRSSDGNCTINDSYGVTSVVRMSSGIYRVTFSTPFANVYYVFSGFARAINDSSHNGSVGLNLSGAKNVSYVDIKISESSTATNPLEVGLIFFGRI